LVLIAWLPVNLWASSDAETSSLSAGYLLFGIAIFVAFVNWPPAQCHPHCVAWLLLLVGTGLAIVSPLLVAWKPEFRLFYLPLYDKLQEIDINLGETIHANVLAGALVTILPFLLILSLQKIKTDTKDKKLQDGKIWRRIRPSRFVSKLLFSFCFLYVLGILVLTQSRSGYLAIIVALPVVLILRWRYLLYVVLPGIFILILLIHQLNFNSFLNQLSSDGSLGGWGGRLDIWTQSVNALYEFPFTGIGIGTFTRVIPLLYPLSFNTENYPHAHNLFLQVGLDLGIPGLIAYLALLINIFVMVIVTLRSPLYHTLAIGAAGSLIAIHVQGLLDAVTWGTKLAFMPWLLFAVITLLFQYRVEEQVSPVVSSE